MYAIHIPHEITNLIFDYYAQLTDMRWRPFIDCNTGKLKWRINKHSTKFKNHIIHKLCYNMKYSSMDAYIKLDVRKKCTQLDTEGNSWPLGMGIEELFVKGNVVKLNNKTEKSNCMSTTNVYYLDFFYRNFRFNIFVTQHVSAYWDFQYGSIYVNHVVDTISGFIDGCYSCDYKSLTLILDENVLNKIINN